MKIVGNPIDENGNKFAKRLALQRECGWWPKQVLPGIKLYRAELNLSIGQLNCQKNCIVKSIAGREYKKVFSQE